MSVKVPSSLRWVVTLIVVMALVSSASADDSQDLAKKLANPVASLISIPFDLDYDHDIGPVDDGTRTTFIAKPVVPITLNPEWNLISRTIVPFVHQDDIFPGAGDQTGLGDIVPSFFFSPAQPTTGGLIWGVGPVFLLPTATDELLGAEKWGLGPTGVVLTQKGFWTYGLLTNHIWSTGGEEARADISSTLLQPFVSYNTPTAWTFSLQTESTYNWEIDHWALPINFIVSKLARLGKLPVQYKAGLRYWADSPDSGPEGFGLKLGFVLLLPK